MAVTFYWMHLSCMRVSFIVHCILSQLHLRTGTETVIVCQQFIASLEVVFPPHLFGSYSLPSPSLWYCLKNLIEFFKAKKIYIFRAQKPWSPKTSLSLYTILSSAFPPVTINYVPLSIIKLILLILANKSKRPLSQASLDVLRLKLFMYNRWLMLTCYYSPNKKVHWKNIKAMSDTK